MIILSFLFVSASLIPVGQAAIVMRPAPAVSIHPDWMPIILSNDPSAYLVEVVDSGPMISFPLSGPCFSEVAGTNTSASCAAAVWLDLPLDEGPTAEILAILSENGIVVEPTIPELVFQAGEEYTSKCWYLDSGHYRCCYYYESGMVTCYDYYYQCRKNGVYSKQCGWSSKMTYHTCDSNQVA